MKKFKIAFIPAIFIFISFLVAGPGNNQKAEWKGTVEIEDGIKVIKNPGEPLYGEIEFELKEELSLKKRLDVVTNFAVDSEGNIYVTEKTGWEVKKFSPKGKIIKKFGQEPRSGSGANLTVTAGGGPFLHKVLINENNGYIYTLSSIPYSIDVYDQEETFIKRYPFTKIMKDFWVDVDGKFWAKVLKNTEILSEKKAEWYYVFGKVTAPGIILKEITVFPDKLSHFISRIQEGRVVAGGAFSLHGYEYDLIVSRVNDAFVYGFSKVYELNVIDKSGVLLYKIKKEEPAQPFTLEERSEIIRSQYSRYTKKQHDLIEFPEIRPFFKKIITDDKGRIYVQRLQSPLDKTIKYEFDIFSRKGYYLYKTTFPYSPHVINNGYCYAHILNEKTEAERIMRFKIVNWDQIRAEADIQSD
jgi:hypothetical protein